MSSFHIFLSQTSCPCLWRQAWKGVCCWTRGLLRMHVWLKADWSTELRVSADSEMEWPAARVPPYMSCQDFETGLGSDF